MINRLLLAVAFLAGAAAVFQGCGADRADGIDKENGMLRGLLAGADEVLYDSLLPVFSFAGESAHGTFWLFQEQLDSLVPAYGYFTRGMTPEETAGEEAQGLPRETFPEEEAPGETGYRTLSFAEALESLGEEEDRRPPETEKLAGERDGADLTLAELLQAENEAALYMLNQGNSPVFTPHQKQVEVDLAPLARYETLVKQFYTIDANTMAGSEQLNLSKFLEQDMTVDKDGEGPQILIYHTHSQEAFADSEPGDAADTIMGVGERLAQILTDTYGYKVLHHTGQYDVKARDDAYAVALPSIEKVLEENPSIEVVIDLHRDEMAEGTRLVTEVDGRPTAKFMFFNGLSRTKKTGNIAYLYNENLGSNLAFSFQMQLKAMEYYPGLTRRIYLKGYRYNMHLRPKYLLIELGAQNNTVEEAMNACDPLAHILDLVLSGEGE